MWPRHVPPPPSAARSGPAPQHGDEHSLRAAGGGILHGRRAARRGPLGDPWTTTSGAAFVGGGERAPMCRPDQRRPAPFGSDYDAAPAAPQRRPHPNAPRRGHAPFGTDGATGWEKESGW